MKTLFKGTIAIALASVLAVAPATANTDSSPKSSVSEVVAQKVNLNHASAEQLVTLPGIGKKKAQAILNYRATEGNFMSIEDIQNVKGIGKKAFAKLETLIEV